MQPFSEFIWSLKYQLKDKEGNIVDKTIEDSKNRVAKALASVEKSPKKWEKEFRKALDYCIPAGRIMSNAGAEKHKTAVSLINCIVSDTIDDDMDSIFKKLNEAALTLKAGCGIGYEFSSLRPRGTFVHGAGAETSGPMSFMDVYDKMCFTIMSAGGRRGAQMGTFDISHSDVVEFIKAKREDGRLRQFNLSVLITDEFINAVKNDLQWEFKWNGEVVKSMPARELWEIIMRSTYDYAEPGFLLIDAINKANNLWFCENIRATNPCVTGNTVILTDKGYKRIDSLVDTLVKIWNGYEWSYVTPKVTGENQEVIDIDFSDGSTLSCTPYHKFVIKEENLRKEAKDLRFGDHIENFEFPVIVGNKVNDDYENKIPVASSSMNFRVYWLNKYLIDNSTVIDDGSVIVKDKDYEFLTGIKYLLNSLGSSCSIEKDENLASLIINPYYILKLAQVGLELPTNFKTNTTKPVLRITGIRHRENKEEKVYCFTELKNHTGIFNGVMTSNCGEQPLPPYGSCLLGSVMLHKFVKNPFTDSASFDFDTYSNIIKVFTRMLDNVIEIANVPLKQQDDELKFKRRHGMGYLGLGSALSMLGIKYGSDEAVKFTEKITKELAMVSYETGVELAQEKGMAPVLNKIFDMQDVEQYASLNKNKNFEPSKDYYYGKDLLVESHYFDNWRDDERGKKILSDIKEHGCRFSHATSIAPTGTISASFGENCSGGIEPQFAHSYIRNVLVIGNSSKQDIETNSYEFHEYKKLNPEASTDNLPDYFVVADDLMPIDHIKMQSAAQKWVDSSISKTINVPTDIKFENFKDIYMQGYDNDLKGVTTFRFNPEVFTGVLVKKEDLKNTKYKFNLKNGQTVEVTGDQYVEYEGQKHLASNLADAIKNGYYKKT